MPTDGNHETQITKPGAKCPICGKPVEQKYRPFCSQRCQQVDLSRWLGERYRIPAEQPLGELSDNAESDEG